MFAATPKCARARLKRLLVPRHFLLVHHSTKVYRKGSTIVCTQQHSMPVQQHRSLPERHHKRLPISRHFLPDRGNKMVFLRAAQKAAYSTAFSACAAYKSLPLRQLQSLLIAWCFFCLCGSTKACRKGSSEGCLLHSIFCLCSSTKACPCGNSKACLLRGHSCLRGST